jgi:hypothetical protein
VWKNRGRPHCSGSSEVSFFFLLAIYLMRLSRPSEPSDIMSSSGWVQGGFRVYVVLSLSSIAVR